VLRQTGGHPVTISGNYSIDLDSRSANWGVGPGRQPNGDIFVLSPTNAVFPYGDFIRVSERASYSDCENSTERSRGNIPDDERQANATFCVRTSDGRWARVTLRTISPKISVDILVWDNAG
jgi:hypothetical protein